MKRYASIDFLRGLAIFMMVFLHLLDDLYDLSWIDTGLNSAPLLNVGFLLVGLYMGSWAGLFLMVSATGNMVSMMNSYEKGSSPKSIVVKQVVGGFILLFFGFLAEGTLQYYALFQTIRSGENDWTRILWKGFTMETIHTIAWCMVVNGIIQGLLSMKDGFKKIKRNIHIYVIIAIAVFVLTQPIWDWARSLFPEYPAPGYSLYVLPENSNRTVQGPLDLWNLGEYVAKFFLLPLAGHPEPIFPFLAVSCIGSIVGLLIVQEPADRTWPKKGVAAGFLVILAGLLIWVIADMPFDSLLPLNDFSIFRRIGKGLNFLWVPWLCFITGGQIVAVALIFRLVEYRGKAKPFAEKTGFVRRFGMVAFTMYTFHRSLAMIPLGVLSLIFQRDMFIDCKDMDIFTALASISVCVLFLHALIRLWENKDYIGSLEWMIGTIGAYMLRVPKKSPQKVPWYRWGARDQKQVFYDVQWINAFEEKDPDNPVCNSKLAFKFALTGLLGLVLFPATFIAIGMSKSALAAEGQNKYNHRAKALGIVALILNFTLLTVLYFLNLGLLGISL